MKARKLSWFALSLGLLPAGALAQSDPAVKDTAPDTYDHSTDAGRTDSTSASSTDPAVQERRQELSALRRDIEDAKNEVSSGGKEKLDKLRERVDKLEEKSRTESGSTSSDFRTEMSRIRQDLQDIKPATGHEHPEDRRSP